MYDYVEFVAEYAPWDLFTFDDLCRAAELHGLSTMVKVEQDPRSFIAQRAIGSGFESVLFADCRNAQDARDCVAIARPDSPEDGGNYGVASRRFTFMGYGGAEDYLDMIRDIVVVLMVEKQTAVDDIEEFLAAGVDMIQWGPSDFSMSCGKIGQGGSPEIKAVEREVIAKALEMGVHPRAEIGSPEEAKYYLDLGVKHFCIGTDIAILFGWWKDNGEKLRSLIS